jgi:hypothetical protein
MLPINTCKKISEFGQREVIYFFTLVANKGEHSIKQTLTGNFANVFYFLMPKVIVLF